MESKTTYVQVYDICLTEMGLNITEAYILCYIYGWCKGDESHGQREYTMKQDKMAARCGISVRCLRGILNKLCDKEYLCSRRTNKGVGYSIPTENNSAKFAEWIGKICRMDRQNLPNDSAKFAEYTLNYKINNYIMREYSPARVREYGEKIVEGLADIYQKNGMRYVPWWETVEQYTPVLVEKLQEIYGSDADLAVVWPAWLAKVFPGADAFQRANFDLPIICSQFNRLNNNSTINNTHGNTYQAEPEPQQTGTATSLDRVASREELAALDGIWDTINPTTPSRP